MDLSSIEQNKQNIKQNLSYIFIQFAVGILSSFGLKKKL